MPRPEESHYRTRSFWHEVAPAYEPAPPLEGDRRADVAIIGGGYTGLWTAYHLKAEQPSLEVAVLEQEVCGYGASGRNGGFAITLLGRFLAGFEAPFGP